MNYKLMAFLSVARHGNFSRAAESLHMSQPAVSQQIQSLEQELGVKLFERNTKRVALTRAGKIVEHYGTEIETTFDVMKRRLEDLTDVMKGPLMIGASYTFGEYVLPYAVAAFCQVYPDVHPSIHISNTIQVAQLIQEDAMDVGIVEGEVKLPGVKATELMQDEMLVIASPSHAAAKEARPNLTAPDITWILREGGSGTRSAADRLLKDLGVEVQAKMEFSSTQAIKASVEAGLGLSVLSELAIQHEAAEQTLVALPTEGHLTSSVRPFYLLSRESTFTSRVAQGFREFLVTYVQSNYPGKTE